MDHFILNDDSMGPRVESSFKCIPPLVCLFKLIHVDTYWRDSFGILAQAQARHAVRKWVEHDFLWSAGMPSDRPTGASRLSSQFTQTRKWRKRQSRPQCATCPGYYFTHLWTGPMIVHEICWFADAFWTLWRESKCHVKNITKHMF